ncbi:UNVERIFIED_CONTAM: hypothetical protein FKN15_053422 [Acipenser sinensis]
MGCFSLNVGVLLCVLLHEYGVHGISFYLPPRARKCLREEIRKDVLVTGQYEVTELHDVVTNLKIYGFYNSREMQLLCIASMYLSSRVRFDNSGFSFLLGFEGATEQLIVLNIKHGTEAKNYENIAKAEKLKPLEVKLRQMEDLSESIARELSYMKSNAEHRSNTNACNECGATNHLYRECPNRTYASAAKGQEEKMELRPIEIVLQEIQDSLVSPPGPIEEVKEMGSPSDTALLEGDNGGVKEQGDCIPDSELAELPAMGEGEEENETMEGKSEESQGTMIPDTIENRRPWGERVEEAMEEQQEKWNLVPGTMKRKLEEGNTDEATLEISNMFQGLPKILDMSSEDYEASLVSVSLGSQMIGDEEKLDKEGYLGKNEVEGFLETTGFSVERKKDKGKGKKQKKTNH